MELYCDQELLATALKAVLPAVPSRPLTPADAGVLLNADAPAQADGRLELAATDREVAIRYLVGAHVTGPGQVVLPARTIADLAPLLDPERIDLALDPETCTLALRCGRTLAHVRGWKAEEFPALPASAGEPLTRVEAAAFGDAIGRVIYAASPDQSRPALCGVLMQMTAAQATLVATDGLRLALCVLPLATPVGEPLDLTVPARGMRELQRQAREDVTVRLDEGRQNVIFETGDVVIGCQLGGKYPDYRPIIPQEWDVRAAVDRAALLQACRTARALHDGVGAVCLEFTPPDRVVVSASSVETGEGRTELEATVEGQPAALSLNVRYLADAVGATRGEQVAIETGAPQDGQYRPVAVRPVGAEGQLGLIMPMSAG